MSEEPSSLHAITDALRAQLRAHGRADLAANAVGRVAYTDDGTTIYVHIFARDGWSQRRPGQAYVLAFADKDRLQQLSQFRELLREAWLRLRDDINLVIRWFDGR